MYDDLRHLPEGSPMKLNKPVALVTGASFDMLPLDVTSDESVEAHVDHRLG